MQCLKKNNPEGPEIDTSVSHFWMRKTKGRNGTSHILCLFCHKQFCFVLIRYEQKILDMAKGVSKMRKSLVPKSEVEEVKRERAKAVSHEQQRFRQELTTKTSLIDSLKKKLKSLQEKKEKEVVAYAQCAEKLSQRVKTLTAELSKAKTEKLNDQSTVYKEVYKEEIAKLKLKVEEQKKMLDKAGQLQAQNAQLQEQVNKICDIY